MPTALDVVDGEVRELIRRRGLDPFTDPGPVRVLVRDVIAQYSERSLNSARPPIADTESIVRDVLDRVAGFGPLMWWSCHDPWGDRLCERCCPCTHALHDGMTVAHPAGVLARRVARRAEQGVGKDAALARRADVAVRRRGIVVRRGVPVEELPGRGARR